ncbi:MAG: hypothetical protein ACJATQ_001209, partial [Cellvibrionaceae bacterium]
KPELKPELRRDHKVPHQALLLTVITFINIIYYEDIPCWRRSSRSIT